MPGIVVFLEPSGEKGDEINKGLVAEGARIARLTGGSLSALSVGSPAPAPETIEGYGASRLIRVGGSRLSRYAGETFAWAAAEVLKTMPFRLLLFAHTDRGSELAPRLAWLLDSAAAMDCVDLRVEEGRIVYARLVYGGQLGQEISYAVDVPQIASIRTDGLYPRKAAATAPSLSIVDLSVDVPASLRATEPLETIPADYRTVDILYAKTLIGIGAGSEESLALAEELADLLAAATAATRPVVDDGLVPKVRMVGQTGKTVAPDLYLALGISGSPHHVAGIQDAKEVLSVNRDPKAPVFGFSDAGFVGDVRSLLPKLIERIKRYREDHEEV